MELQKGDYVNAFYKGSRFTGKIGSVDARHGEAEVVFSKGVSMILPTADITVITEKEFIDGTHAD